MTTGFDGRVHSSGMFHLFRLQFFFDCNSFSTGILFRLQYFPIFWFSISVSLPKSSIFVLWIFGSSMFWDFVRQATMIVRVNNSFAIKMVFIKFKIFINEYFIIICFRNIIQCLEESFILNSSIISMFLFKFHINGKCSWFFINLFVLKLENIKIKKYVQNINLMQMWKFFPSSKFSGIFFEFFSIYKLFEQK